MFKGNPAVAGAKTVTNAPLLILMPGLTVPPIVSSTVTRRQAWLLSSRFNSCGSLGPEDDETGKHEQQGDESKTPHGVLEVGCTPDAPVNLPYTLTGQDLTLWRGAPGTTQSCVR